MAFVKRCTKVFFDVDHDGMMNPSPQRQPPLMCDDSQTWWCVFLLDKTLQSGTVQFWLTQSYCLRTPVMRERGRGKWDFSWRQRDDIEPPCCCCSYDLVLDCWSSSTEVLIAKNSFSYMYLSPQPLVFYLDWKQVCVQKRMWRPMIDLRVMKMSCASWSEPY